MIWRVCKHWRLYRIIRRRLRIWSRISPIRQSSSRLHARNPLPALNDRPWFLLLLHANWLFILLSFECLKAEIAVLNFGGDTIHSFCVLLFLLLNINVLNFLFVAILWALMGLNFLGPTNVKPIIMGFC